jgi:hypothetical protein
VFLQLDRVFYSTDSDGHFPLALARALPRNTSDYIPVLWESGLDHRNRRGRFKFEKW